jgi:hypothetical protein
MVLCHIVSKKLAWAFSTMTEQKEIYADASTNILQMPSDKCTNDEHMKTINA